MNTQASTLHTRRYAPDARFWDRIAARYAAKPITDMESYTRKLAVTRGHLRSDHHVLELGCGTGGTALAHAPYVRQVTATDISAGMLKIAEERRRTSGLKNVDFVTTSVENFDAPSSSYDAVLALSVLHLLSDPEAAMRKMGRLLKPGGVLVTNTACLGDNMRWFTPVARIGAALGLIPQVTFLTRAQVRQMTQRHGFAVIEEFVQDDGRTYFQIARRLA